MVLDLQLRSSVLDFPFVFRQVWVLHPLVVKDLDLLLGLNLCLYFSAIRNTHSKISSLKCLRFGTLDAFGLFDVPALFFQVLRLHLEFPEPVEQIPPQTSVTAVKRSRWTSAHSGILAGTIVLTGISVAVYLKRANSWQARYKFHLIPWHFDMFYISGSCRGVCDNRNMSGFNTLRC